jgi:hypothetical protein
MEETVLHILNNFDIPLGFIRDNDDPAHDDHTLPHNAFAPLAV